MPAPLPCEHGPKGCPPCRKLNIQRVSKARRDRNKGIAKVYNQKYHAEHKAEINARMIQRYYDNHEECKAKSRDFTKNNPEKRAVYNGAIYYPDAPKAELYRRQEGKCKICELLPTQNNPLCGDHDHGKPGEPNVRGLLHRVCNSGMGALKDDPRLLRRAADFIEDPRLDPLDYIWDFA